MTREEFSKIIAYIATATDKELSLDRLEVYFDLLGDLQFNVLLTAAKRVVLEHPWATFPSIAELRAAASATIRGKVNELSPAEAWLMAWKVVRRVDPEVEGSFDRATKDLPPIVVEAILAYGLQSLVYGGEPVGVVRGQFLKIYEQLAARDKRAALIPAAVKQAIEGIGRTPPAIPANVAPALAGIGRPVE